MTARWKLAAALAAAGALAACESLPPGQAEAPVAAAGAPPGPALVGGGPAAGRMSAQEVLAAMTDNTIAVLRDGVAYHAYLHHDGRQRFRQGEWNDQGAWRVTDDGQFCSRLERTGGNFEQCYAIVRLDNGSFAFERDGRRVGTFLLLRGNSQNL